MSSSVTRALDAVRSELHLDAGLLSPVTGAVTALPVVAVFAIGLAAGSTQAAIAMAIGANLVAIVSLVGAPRIPIRLAALDAVSMAISVFVGAATGAYPWLHDLLLVPWCFGAGMLVVFGQTQATIGTQAIIAYVVLGRFSGSPLVSFHLALLVAAGGLVEVGALFVLKLPPSLRYQRNRLANALDAVADLARRDPQIAATDVLAVLDEAERALSKPALFGRSDVRDLRACLDQVRRLRVELTALAGLRARDLLAGHLRARAHLDSCLSEAATVLTKIADGVRRPLQPTSWNAGSTAFQTAVTAFEEALGGDRADGETGQQFVRYLEAIGGQIRAAGSLADRIRTTDSWHVWRPQAGPRHRSEERGWRTDLAIVRDNLRTDSPAFRHAVRLAAAVPASALVAAWLGLPRSYWVPFAVAVILKPDYSTLFGKGVGRILGTLLGACLAAVVVSELHPGSLLTIGLVASATWVAYSTWSASFSVSIGFVTALVLILLSTSLTDTVGTAVDRVVDVALGGAVAAVAYLAWPTSPQATIGEAQSQLFEALADYLAVVLDLVANRQVDRSQITSCSRASRLAWAAAETATRRSTWEPGFSTQDHTRDRGLLAAALRLVRAIHALRLEAERGQTVEGSDALDALADGLRQANDSLTHALRNGPAESVAELRPLYQAVELVLAQRGAPSSISAHLDEIVNATDTALHLVAPEPGRLSQFP